MKKLSTLLENVEFQCESSLDSIEIESITYDSRKVRPGSLFVAMKGEVSDGHHYIPQAIEQGAAAIVGEDCCKSSVPFIQVKNSRVMLAQLAKKWFEDPSASIDLVGVTGTNGKTTLTYLIEAILKTSQKKPAVFGTINYRFENQIQAASHTTPESIDLLQYLSSFQKQGCDSVVMEVSSHALHRHRVDGLEFNGAVFTNLSPEHLDYHLEMNDYFQAKAILFREHLLKSQKSNRFAILNIDDEHAIKLVSDLASVQIFSFSLRSTQADLYPLNYHLNLEGVQTEIQTPWGVISLKSRLLGAFNLSNLLAAIAVGGALGISLPLIKKALEEFSFVPGRLEKIENKNGIHVFVDYAHTPDALRHVLSSLKNLKTPESRLITVFGCGGDRDRGKRPLMGNEVARSSDFAWVTSDNPRTEDPQKIIQDILPGIKAQKLDAEKSIHLQIDRRLAIQEALQFARPGDVVLIAGKGHEDYQMIGKEKIHFDDREIARSFLA